MRDNMVIRVFYDNGNDVCQFEYFSKFDRVNAKGIKDEIINTIYKKYGKSCKILSWERVDYQKGRVI